MNEMKKCAALVVCLCASCGVSDGHTTPEVATSDDTDTTSVSASGSRSTSSENSTTKAPSATVTSEGNSTPAQTSVATQSPDTDETNTSAPTSELMSSDESSGDTDATSDTASTSTASSGGATGGTTTQEVEPLDCGADGWAVENHGPPENRVNYVILADGYDSTTINTTLEDHIHTALQRRFEHESGEPYGRYRNFVNICVMKVVSENNGIGNGPTASTAATVAIAWRG